SSRRSPSERGQSTSLRAPGQRAPGTAEAGVRHRGLCRGTCPEPSPGQPAPPRADGPAAHAPLTVFSLLMISASPAGRGTVVIATEGKRSRPSHNALTRSLVRIELDRFAPLAMTV